MLNKKQSGLQDEREGRGNRDRATYNIGFEKGEEKLRDHSRFYAGKSSYRNHALVVNHPRAHVHKRGHPPPLLDLRVRPRALRVHVGHGGNDASDKVDPLGSRQLVLHWSSERKNHKKKFQLGRRRQGIAVPHTLLHQSFDLVRGPGHEAAVLFRELEVCVGCRAPGQRIEPPPAAAGAEGVTTGSSNSSLPVLNLTYKSRGVSLAQSKRHEREELKVSTSIREKPLMHEKSACVYH